MDKNFLLTFFNTNTNYPNFTWFDTEEELKEFVANNGLNIHIIKAIEIIQVREINI